jgi:hypothetical protein
MNNHLDKQRQVIRKLAKLPLVNGLVLAVLWIALLTAVFFAGLNFYLILLAAILLVGFIVGFRLCQYGYKIDKMLSEINDVRTEEATFFCCRIKCLFGTFGRYGWLPPRIFSLRVLRFFDQDGTEYCYPLPDLVMSDPQHWRALKSQLVGQEVRLNCYRGTKIVESVKNLSMSDMKMDSMRYEPQFKKKSKS